MVGLKTRLEIKGSGCLIEAAFSTMLYTHVIFSKHVIVKCSIRTSEGGKSEMVAGGFRSSGHDSDSFILFYTCCGLWGQPLLVVPSHFRATW